MDSDEPHLTLNEKNTAHSVDRMANWCIGGCWFTLALHEGCLASYQFQVRDGPSMETFMVQVKVT